MNTVSRGNTSPINTGGLREDWAASNQQYFIPVDRQTYENWTQQFKEGIELSIKISSRKLKLNIVLKFFVYLESCILF